MIECTYRVVAVYPSEAGETLLPVVAWGDSGEPYVLGPVSLVLAAKEPGFSSIRFASDTPRDPTTPDPVVVRPKRTKDRDQ